MLSATEVPGTLFSSTGNGQTFTQIHHQLRQASPTQPSVTSHLRHKGTATEPLLGTVLSRGTRDISSLFSGKHQSQRSSCWSCTGQSQGEGLLGQSSSGAAFHTSVRQHCWLYKGSDLRHWWWCAASPVSYIIKCYCIWISTCRGNPHL